MLSQLRSICDLVLRFQATQVYRWIWCGIVLSVGAQRKGNRKRRIITIIPHVERAVNAEWTYAVFTSRQWRVIPPPPPAQDSLCAAGVEEVARRNRLGARAYGRQLAVTICTGREMKSWCKTSFPHNLLLNRVIGSMGCVCTPSLCWLACCRFCSTNCISPEAGAIF